jgi:ERCC4-type nuclease
VFTEVRGRPAIFWQTQRTARTTNPGGRVPRGRAIVDQLTITVDTRERYPFRFSRADVETERAALPAGDYGVRRDGVFIAAVERKTLENLAGGLSDGTLAFQMQRLAELPRAAVVVEGRYPGLLAIAQHRASFVADILARLQHRYPEIQVVFADNRKFAEEWTYRYLAAAMSDDLPGADLKHLGKFS